MEVLVSPDCYIFYRDDYSLWFTRSKESKVTVRRGIDVYSLANVKCLGIAYGIIGKFNNDKLLLVKNYDVIGNIPSKDDKESPVFKIKRVCIIHLDGEDPDLNEVALVPCHRHNSGEAFTPGSVVAHNAHQTHSSTGAVQKTWNTLKNATSHVQAKRGHRNNSHLLDAKEKHEKRIIDELLRMFNDTDSFYYSNSEDLTNTIQRKQSQDSADQPIFKRVDERFFWNKHMVSSLIEAFDGEHAIEVLDFWIMPIIQGFIQIELCGLEVDFDRSPVEGPDSFNLKEYKMTLISRRSRFRAGTRYKKRGVDDVGKCANYVETEQIFKYGSHLVSFVQVRGSVPIYWSQPGHAYRPPPKLDGSRESSQAAFEAHFKEEFSIYGNEVIINLVERWGKEKILRDAYLNHVLNLDSPNLTYVAFDFHEYCRGMKFENVTILIEHVKDIIRDMRYCWVDKQGVICTQNGTFRINCVDCLDRTNIVQTAIARTVMDIQFARLGVLSPDGILPPASRRTFQLMWANNGDTISRQYAGTSALKGDYTRTGERRLAGVVKDSYNSANRYYQNRFKDASRQATIDMMLGIPVTESDLHSPDNESLAVDDEDDGVDQEHHERVKQVIEDCKKILIPENEIILGGWPLIDCDPANHNTTQDMDTVLILTKDAYYVAEYDDQTDRIMRYQKVLLEDLEKIEFGLEPSSQILSAVRRCKPHYCIRFHYLVNGQGGYFHMFRPTNTRFFNNMAIPVRTPEEAIESLKAIGESFKVALSVKSLNVPFFEGKLEKRKNKPVSLVNSMHAGHHRKYGAGLSGDHLPRNISDGNLLNLKSVGSRAFNNVSSHFAKFRGKFTASTRSNPHLPKSPLNEPHEISSLATSNLSCDLEISSGDEDSEEDSIRKIRKQRLKDQQMSFTSTSSVFLAERTLSSDYSECSDFEDQEPGTPVAEADGRTPADHIGVYAKDSADTILESCGILTTSPPLRQELAGNSLLLEHFTKRRSLLQDVDDFVLDAMKKASLRHLHRKASESLTHIASSAAPSIRITDPKEAASDVFDIVAASPKARKLSKSSEDIDSARMVALLSSSSEATSASCAAIAAAANEDEMYERNFEAESGAHSLGGLHTLSTGSKMKTSHSETAIQDSTLSLNLPGATSTPIVIKKDLVLSPLSRIAKGVQNLSINLMTGQAGFRRHPPGCQLDEDSEQLSERKLACKSKIIDI